MKRASSVFTTNVCLNCSKKGGCCSGKHFLVPVTIKDIKRIERQGYNKKDFLIANRYSKRDIVGPEKWWVNSFIDIGGKKYKLGLKRGKNECVFLKDGEGCVLGNNRTFFCRIYPFWIEKGKIIIEEGDGKYCEVNKKSLSLNDKFKIMCENPNKIKRFYSEIKKDSLDNKKKHEELLLSILNQK